MRILQRALNRNAEKALTLLIFASSLEKLTYICRANNKKNAEWQK